MTNDETQSADRTRDDSELSDDDLEQAAGGYYDDTTPGDGKSQTPEQLIKDSLKKILL